MVKVTVDRKGLEIAARACGRVCKRSGSSMPVLGRIRLEARAAAAGAVSGGPMVLELAATDLETALRLELEASGPAPFDAFAVTVDAGELLAAVKGSGKGGAVTLGLEASGVHVSGPSGVSSTLEAGDPEEWPALPVVGHVTAAELPGAELLGAIAGAFYASSRDETRYNLNGLYLEADLPSGLLVTATDGHRLAQARAGGVSGELPTEYGAKRGAILPAAAVIDLEAALKLRAFRGAKVSLFGNGGSGLDPDTLELSMLSDGSDGIARLELASRLIDGEYPNYRQVIPEAGGARRFSLPRLETADRLKALRPMLAPRSLACRLELHAGELEAVGEHDGKRSSALVTLPETAAANVVGWVAGFNAGYLEAALRALPGDVAHVYVAELEEIPAKERKPDGPTHREPLSPIRLESDAGGGVALGVVMPMRL